MNAPLPTPSAVRTACPYCGVGCGVLARPQESGRVGIAGDPDHPANFGRLCSKGFALGETLALDGRLLHPMIQQADGGYRGRPGTQATARVADGLQHILDRHGPQAIAFYLSGQLLTEDYYVANKLAKGFLGTANVDTNSRLCMASTVAGHRRAFGADVVPGCYDDLDLADLIVLVGSNTAWCHPVLYRRIVDSRDKRGARIVVIDPRCTVTGADADLFLPIAPGTDTALFCGLLVYLAEHGALDRAYIDAHTTGFAETLARAAEIAPTPRAAAAATGLAERDVVRFFDLFLETRRTVTCFSQGVNQSAQGTDKVNAIINCHLATGRIGRPGMGPLSLTGQPNAMGGREVGGLANQLAAHMAFTPPDIDRVRRFWNAPRVAAHEGLKAVQMFEAIERGEIKALWVMATNPAVSLPRAGAMRDALKKLDLFVVSENVAHNDTLAAAPHVLLPAAAWGEKDGTVTNSERRISRQRAFLPRPGETRPDWRIVCDVAKRLGFGEAFAFRSAADVFREHAALSGFENDGTRGFDIGALAAITDAQYDALEPVQWPLRKDGEPSDAPVRRRRILHRRPQGAVRPAGSPALQEQTSAAFPLRLNTGRVRDQWHTMTRTGAEPHARRSSAGAVRRGASARRRATRPDARRLRPRPHRARLLRAPGDRQRGSAARFAVRTDPLERRQRLVGAGRRSGGAAHRSVLRPARIEGDAGRDRARSLRLARALAVALPDRASGRHLVGARCHDGCDGADLRDQRRCRGLAHPRAGLLSRRGADRIRRSESAASIALRRSAADGSAARCLSAPPTRRRNGAICARWPSSPALRRAARSSAPASASRPPTLPPRGAPARDVEAACRNCANSRRPCKWRRAMKPRMPAETPSARMAPLAQLPLFVALDGRRALVAGGTPAAAWKAELLSAAGASVDVYAPAPCRGVECACRRAAYADRSPSGSENGPRPTSMAQRSPSAPSKTSTRARALPRQRVRHTSRSTSSTSRRSAISASAPSSIARRSSSAFRPAARHRSSARRCAPGSKRSSRAASRIGRTRRGAGAGPCRHRGCRSMRAGRSGAASPRRP